MEGGFIKSSKYGFKIWIISNFRKKRSEVIWEIYAIGVAYSKMFSSIIK